MKITAAVRVHVEYADGTTSTIERVTIHHPGDNPRFLKSEAIRAIDASTTDVVDMIADRNPAYVDA